MSQAPEGPKNEKGRPFGSGTTNAKRKEARKHLQWSALENANPSDPAHLLEHLKALEKAQKKCQERLTEEIQNSLDACSSGEPAPKAAKTAGGSKQGLGKPLVIVDWHLTLVQNDDTIAERDLHALKVLASKVDVLILSYVWSAAREAEVPKQVKSLVPFWKDLKGIETVWSRTGEDGKCNFAWQEEALAVFDDHKKICLECAQWGLEIYPICTSYQKHNWYGGGYKSFADAVDEFLGKHGY
ncbi:unnamed protein product [Cladocopium goreaui]|uniref:Uncharacterized protein n=1 Tax=Cladocopium goreaui TaxID=2562237 RepID=A0A9P1G4E0_9DINO|nr:unnamed protein product [Cladocopium goreaui]